MEIGFHRTNVIELAEIAWGSLSLCLSLVLQSNQSYVNVKDETETETTKRSALCIHMAFKSQVIWNESKNECCAWMNTVTTDIDRLLTKIRRTRNCQPAKHLSNEFHTWTILSAVDEGNYSCFDQDVKAKRSVRKYKWTERKKKQREQERKAREKKESNEPWRREECEA